jgi:hypothetical protein
VVSDSSEEPAAFIFREETSVTVPKTAVEIFAVNTSNVVFVPDSNANMITALIVLEFILDYCGVFGFRG